MAGVDTKLNQSEIILTETKRKHYWVYGESRYRRQKQMSLENVSATWQHTLSAGNKDTSPKNQAVDSILILLMLL